jgi:Protein of unknown function (DUF1638)
MPHPHQEDQANQQSQAIQAVVIACGALGGPIRDIAGRRGWPIELHCLPALLHNRPAAITPQVERLAVAAQARGLPVAIGYADCGTYGALDELSARLGLRRLPGLHCYDLLAGPDRVAALFEAEPGTYVLTDFLVRSFRRTVLAGLGLDRYPELWPDYFGHYRRLVWLAQSRDPALDAEAEAVAARFGLPLTVIDTGLSRLERELEYLLAGVAPGTPSSRAQTAVGPVPRQDQSRPSAETAVGPVPRQDQSRPSAETAVGPVPRQDQRRPSAQTAVGPVPPQDQRRPSAQTAAVTTDSAHATLPLAPGHSAARGMRAETAALTTVSAHAMRSLAPGHGAPQGMGEETAAIDHDSGAGPGPEVTGPGPEVSPGTGVAGMTGPGPEVTGPEPGVTRPEPGVTRPGVSLAEGTGPGPGMSLGAGAAGARAAKGTGRCAGGC